MSKSLVIVESPAKAKTISKYLGKDFVVEASVGHIKDLPKNKLGVDLSDGSFAPELIVIPGKEKVVDRLKKLAKASSVIYLAPDPDREGEAIAAHLEDELRGLSKDNSIRRVTFNEITDKAVREAFEHMPAMWIAIWSTRSRPAACSIALSAIKFRLCSGIRCAADYPRAACKP